MTKIEMREYDHLHYLRLERKDTIKTLEELNEKDEAYFDNKIKHSRGLKKEVLMEIKVERLYSRRRQIEKLEHEINVINKRLEELKGEQK